MHSVADKPMTAEQADRLIGLLEEAVPAIKGCASRKPMTVKQAAERWEMNEEQVRRLCATGQIKAFKVGCLWRIPVEANEHPAPHAR